MSGLRAGAGRASVQFPEEIWPIDGFTWQHDELSARVLVLEGEERIAWALLDQTSLQMEPLEAVRFRVAEVTGVAPAAVIVSVTHTFSAPHLEDPSRLPPESADRMRAAHDAVLQAIDTAARQAVIALRPATVSVGTGLCDVNVNRDVELDSGWALGASEEGYSDKSLVVVRIDDANGRPLAVLANYAVQPSIMNESLGADGGRAVTADLAGAAMRFVEAAHPGSVAFFLIGAAGDQAPGLTAVRTVAMGADGRSHEDIGDDGFVLVDLLGERLGLATLGATATATASASSFPVRLTRGELVLPGQRLTPREQIAPTRSHVYVPADVRPLPYVILTIGEIAVVGVQVELAAASGRDIRLNSPYEHTLVATMVNGGAKYLPDAGAFDRFTYEAQSSAYARGGAEELVRHLSERLAALHAASQGAAA